MTDKRKGWFERVRAGKRGALDDFYRQSRAKFVTWSQRQYQLSQDEAIDIYQDAFVVFYDHIVSGKIGELLVDEQTYLFGIAKNLILKHYRKERLSEKKHDYWKLQMMQDYGVNTDELDSMEAALKEALESLKEPCLTILKLFYYYQRDYDFIAGEVGHTDKNVTKTQKSRCLGYLKERIGQYIDK